jgi:hypothetical protein
MTNEFKDKIVRCFDFGLFGVILEQMLEFKKREYYCQWESPFPTSDKAIIGKGINGIDRLQHFEEDLRDENGKLLVDLLVFFDFYKGIMQDDYRKQGFPVFGSSKGEILEVDRWKFKQILKSVGLPVIPATRCIGIDNEREYLESLKKGEVCWIKSSCYRGDQETEKHEFMEDTISWLDHLGYKLGVQRDKIEFINEEEIEGDCEPGYDGLVSDGVYSDWGMIGYERKGEALIGKFFRDEDLPAIVKNVNDRLAPKMKGYQYRGLYSMENRITKEGKCFPLDFCARAGSPSHEGLCKAIKNWSRVAWDVAHGRQAKLELAGKFVGILKFHTQCLQNEFDVNIRFPDSIAPWVMIRNKYVDRGKTYSISQDRGDNAGAVVAVGDSVDEVVELCEKRIEKVKMKKMDHSKTAFNEIREYIKKGEKHGISFQN